MAHSVSAKKRIRQNASRKALNQWRKTQYRDQIKEFREHLLHDLTAAEKQLPAIFKTLDKVAADGTIHKKTASRYKSRLSQQLNTRKASAAA